MGYLDPSGHAIHTNMHVTPLTLKIKDKKGHPNVLISSYIVHYLNQANFGQIMCPQNAVGGYPDPFGL